MRDEGKVGHLRWFAILMVFSGYITESSSERALAVEPVSPEARKVVAKVNGQPIYEDQVKTAAEKSFGKLRRYSMRDGGAMLSKRLQAKVLDKAIGDMLVRQESKKRTIENIDELVGERVQGLERKYGAGPGMEKYLTIRRITMDDLRESLKARVRIDEYLKEQGVLEPEIPEDRIRAMYDADTDGFSRPETVRVSHILFAVDESAAAEEKEQASQKAEQIRKEILDGKDFAEMAKKFSDCNSAPGGGDLGPIKKGYMPAEFEKVALALEKDAVSEVVETKFGNHIIKVLDRQPAGVVPYEEMRGFLEKYLQGEESKKQLASHVAELRKKANIEILLDTP